MRGCKEILGDENSSILFSDHYIGQRDYERNHCYSSNSDDRRQAFTEQSYDDGRMSSSEDNSSDYEINQARRMVYNKLQKSKTAQKERR